MTHVGSGVYGVKGTRFLEKFTIRFEGGRKVEEKINGKKRNRFLCMDTIKVIKKEETISFEFTYLQSAQIGCN